MQKKKERKAKQVRDNEASEEKTSIQGAEPKKAELKTPIIQDGKQSESLKSYSWIDLKQYSLVPIGNGGIGPNYFWTQSVYELNVGPNKTHILRFSFMDFKHYVGLHHTIGINNIKGFEYQHSRKSNFRATQRF